MQFVNREPELKSLEDWWERAERGSLALVWGRRRVGKTALLKRFAEGKEAMFFTGSPRPRPEQLRALTSAANPYLDKDVRDYQRTPFRDWDEAFEILAQVAQDRLLLLVLDEFPELVMSAPELPGILRAAWDHLRGTTKLRILFCGSAVRTMRAIQEERAPLYGRFDLSLPVHPFLPHEAAGMLTQLSPEDRARVWGIVGGVPLYLERWNQDQDISSNLLNLACTPGGSLLTEGELVLATEAEAGDIARQVLYAIAAGRTRHNEVADAVRADPTRTLERLVSLRLIERVSPVTEDPRRTRRRIYRIADNFLAFFLGVLDPYRAEIDRGLGEQIVTAVMKDLEGHMGPRWEEAFRMHLRRMAVEGRLESDVVAVGPFWTAAEDPGEIDAVVLAGSSRAAVLVGEAKWARKVDGERIRRELERKSSALPRVHEDLRFAICAKEEVDGSDDLLAVTAEDIFG